MMNFGQLAPMPVDIDVGLFPALHGLLSHDLLLRLPGFILRNVHHFAVATDTGGRSSRSASSPGAGFCFSSASCPLSRW